MNVLFICNLNRNRSKTAEEIFADTYETRSAGLYNDTPVTAKQIEWADLVIVMEEFQRQELSTRFPKECIRKRILCLGIPDLYLYMTPELVRLLKARMKEQLG